MTKITPGAALLQPGAIFCAKMGREGAVRPEIFCKFACVKALCPQDMGAATGPNNRTTF